MGTIDSQTAHFACPKCGATDSVKATEKGSAYGSSWGSFSKSELFEFSEAPQKYGMPMANNASCKSCGVNATISHK